MNNAEASSSAQAPPPPQQQREFDIWEFVNCSKCHLQFSPDGVSGPSVPFWLTECGHIICNTHLNPNQSCPSCNTQGIEVMPLQKDLPSPMSDWFCSLPFKLDSVAQAIKFQQDVLSSSARYYKNKCGQYRHLVERMRNEIRNIKRENETLRQEIDQSRSGLQEPGNALNTNGKRRMVDYRAATSSPRSIHTPLGPPRITLPPNHDPPPALQKNPGSDGSGSFTRPRSQQQMRPAEAPGSRGFNQQYAYIPPQTPQLQPQQVLSHQQQAPLRHAAAQSSNDRQLMPPPPTPDHARQQAQAHLMNPGTGHRMTMAQPRMSDPGAQGLTNGAPRRQQQVPGVSHASAYRDIDQNYRQSHGHAPAPPGPRQEFTSGTAIQNQNMPPMSGGQVAQTPRRFKPSTSANANATGNGSASSRRFVPPEPVQVSSQRFVPSSAATGPPSGMALPMTSVASSAGHQKRFTPAPVSHTITASTQPQNPPQPHAQRMAFTPRKNRFS